MYLVIGKESCSRCETIKNILNNKGISYDYKLLELLPQEDKDRYMSMARQAKQLAMPIIIKEDKVVDFKEVV
jgi:glutaredoxin